MFNVLAYSTSCAFNKALNAETFHKNILNCSSCGIKSCSSCIVELFKRAGFLRTREVCLGFRDCVNKLIYIMHVFDVGCLRCGVDNKLSLTNHSAFLNVAIL